MSMFFSPYRRFAVLHMDLFNDMVSCIVFLILPTFFAHFSVSHSPQLWRFFLTSETKVLTETRSVVVAVSAHHQTDSVLVEGLELEVAKETRQNFNCNHVFRP